MEGNVLGPGSGIDRMTGREGSDRIDLLSIDANLGRAGDQAFSFVGTQSLTGAGQLRYGTSGTTTIIQGSNDADSAAEFELELAAVTTLAATDFVL
jgi:serralysin